MSLLAWLMLVLNAAQAVPMAAMVHAGSALPHAASMAMPAPASAIVGYHHAAAGHVAPQDASSSVAPAAVADDCCNAGHGLPHAPASSSCHCATMCAPALLPVPGLTVAARLPLAMIAPAAVPTAPQRPAAPPLRPPQG